MFLEVNQECFWRAIRSTSGVCFWRTTRNGFGGQSGQRAECVFGGQAEVFLSGNQVNEQSVFLEDKQKCFWRAIGLKSRVFLEGKKVKA